MNDPATASEQITSIAAAEELDQQRNVDRLIKNGQRDVRTALSNLASLWQARLESKQAKDRVDDPSQRLTALSARLEAEGASAEALKTLEEAPKYGRATEFIDQVDSQAVDAGQQLVDFESSFLAVDASTFEGAADFEEVVSLQGSLTEAKEAVTAEIAKVKDRLKSLLLRQTEAKVMFGVRREAFSIRYAAAVEEQGKHTNLIDEVTRLTSELQTAESIQSRVRATEASKAVAESAYDDAVTKLDGLIAQRHGILKSAADKVADKSSNLLRARVRKDHLPEEYLSGLHKLFEAFFTQQVEEGCVDWVKAALADEDSGGWAALRKAFLELYEAKIMAGSPPEASDGLLAALTQTLLSTVMRTR